MGPYSVGDKLRLSAMVIAGRVGFVLAVVAVSLSLGVGALWALALVSSVLASWTLVGIWFPANRRRPASDPGSA